MQSYKDRYLRIIASVQTSRQVFFQRSFHRIFQFARQKLDYRIIINKWLATFPTPLEYLFSFVASRAVTQGWQLSSLPGDSWAVPIKRTSFIRIMGTRKESRGVLGPRDIFFFFFAPRDSQNSANGFAFALNVFREKCRLLRNIEEL